MLFSRVKISCFRAKTHLEFQWCLDKYFVLSSSQSFKSCGFRSVTERLGYLLTSRTDPLFSEGSLCLLKIVTTVKSLYCGHNRGLEVVSLLARVRNSGSLFQSNVCNLFSREFRCCPFYRDVRKARADCIKWHTYHCRLSSLVPLPIRGAYQSSWQ